MLPSLHLQGIILSIDRYGKCNPDKMITSKLEKEKEMASFSKHHLTKQISTWINVHGKSFFFKKNFTYLIQMIYVMHMPERALF